MRGPRHTRSISTKVTEADYERFREAAGVDTISDWVRDQLKAAVNGPQENKLELLAVAEVLALRRILLNLRLMDDAGDHVTKAKFEALVAESDAKKMDLVRLRIEG